jgi:DNA-binding GntR family transcriptional regulator
VPPTSAPEALAIPVPTFVPPAVAGSRRLLPVQPRTMVEQAAEAVVAAAARGVFLPGDRLVEAEIARELGISRVPVREALRLLESQGIVVSTPYKGMRLMQVTNRGVAELMRVRSALECLALQEILAADVPADGLLAAAALAAERYREACAGGDAAAAVGADEAFHGELCQVSGNATLFGLWQGLSRQMSVIWGLGYGHRSAEVVAAEHAAILTALAAGDVAAAETALITHLLWHANFDFEAEVERRRGR